MKSTVAIVIVNYRTADLTIANVEALTAERVLLPDLKVMVVDNGSGDGSAEKLAASLMHYCNEGWLEIVPLPINGGFGWANNQGILRLMRRPNPPEFISLLNPDAIIEVGAILTLYEAILKAPDCAVAGSQLINPDDSLSGSAFRFPTIGREFVGASKIHALGRLMGVASTLVEIGKAGSVDWVTGASCMIRTDALAQCGLFDDGFFLYFEEVELMFRLRKAGWDIQYVPSSRVKHIGGAATGVREGKSERNPGKPDYWFHSRRRFHALSHGRFKAGLAGIAWLSGNFVGNIGALIKPTLRDSDSALERKALKRIGIWATPSDASPRIAHVNDALDTPPSWMNGL